MGSHSPPYSSGKCRPSTLLMSLNPDLKFVPSQARKSSFLESPDPDLRVTCPPGNFGVMLPQPGMLARGWRVTRLRVGGGQPLSQFCSLCHHPHGSFSRVFPKPSGKMQPRAEDRGSWVSNGKILVQVQAFLTAGCIWTAAPTPLGLSVPICRRRREDWIIRLWRPSVPHQHHSVNGTWEVPPTTSAAWPHFWLCLIRQVAPFGPQSPQPSAMKRSPSMEAGCPGVLSQKGQEVLGVQGYAQ